MVYKYKNLILSDRRLRRKLKNLSLTFTRASVAYDYQGNSVPENTPRFNHLINGVVEHGCLIEEAHNNILTADQSTAGDVTNSTDGFYSDRTTITRVTDESYQGDGCIEVVTSETEWDSSIGILLYMAVAGNYTFTIKAKGEPTDQFQMANVGVSPFKFNLTEDWKEFTINAYFPAGATHLRVGKSTPGAITFYIDRLQVTKTLYPLSWTLGGTTQAAETLTAPNSTIDLSTGTVELEVLKTAALANTTVSRSLFIHHDNTTWIKNRIQIMHGSSGWSTILCDNAGSNKQTDIADTHSTNSWIKLAAKYDIISQNVGANGVLQTPTTTPDMPTVKGSIGIGNLANTALADSPANAIFRNITISLPKRSDAEITDRSNRNSQGQGFMVDKEIKLVAPLTTNLNAYRVKG